MHAQLQRFIPESLSQRMHTASSEMTGENRLITTLFADISGFSALTNQHSPEHLVEIVNRCFKGIVDVVCRYEGSVNRFIGDNVLAFFGAPIAHENDAERAALAALEMRDAVLELNLNISVGINTGFMYVGKIGVEQHTEYSAYGPEINLAKRLQENASGGHILVGPGTYRLIRRAFEFRAVGPLPLKGMGPTTAYELLGPALHPQKLRGIEGLESRLIGRDREFAILTECAESWLAGKGQLVSIIGEAGIGKSRLVSELKTHLQRQEEGKDGRMEDGVGDTPHPSILPSFHPFPSKHGNDFRSIRFRDPKTRDVGGDSQEFILGFPANGGLRLNEDHGFGAEHRGVDPFRAGVKINEDDTALGDEDAGFCRNDKLPFLINLPVFVIVNPVGRIAGLFINVTVIVVINAVVLPMTNFGKGRDFPIFINLSIFVVVDAIFGFLKVAVQHIVGDAPNPNPKAMGNIFKRIVWLDLIPKSANLLAIKICEFAAAGIEKSSDQAAGGNKNGVVFDKG
jgi:class 3 adenylate cyclase